MPLYPLPSDTEIPVGSPPIRVVLADDHVVVRRGLEVFLSAHEDLLVVGEARDGMEALRLCQQLAPDVILLDIFMPLLDGVQSAQAIQASCPRTRIVMLSGCLSAETIYASLEAGALGYLSKTVAGSEVVEAIRAAHAGELTLSADVIQLLVEVASVAAPYAPGQGKEHFPWPEVEDHATGVGRKGMGWLTSGALRSVRAACAAANRATGTRKGEQLT